MIADNFLHSSSRQRPIRVGILLDEPRLPRCFEQIIDDIKKSAFATIELLIVRAPQNPPPSRSRHSQWRILWDVIFDSKHRKHLAFEIYHKLDRKYFFGPDHPQWVVDCTGKLEGIESLQVSPIERGFSQRIAIADIEKIREKDLDVILRFGFNILRGDILTAARYGVWSYHHGDNEFYRGGPAHFWELYEKSELSGVILQVLTEELDAGRVLAKALFSTVRNGISTLQNRFTPYWGTTHLVIQKLCELHNYGWEHLDRQAVPNSPYQGKRKIYSIPGNWELCKWLVPALARKIARRVVSTWTGEETCLWRIAIRTGSNKRLYDLDPGNHSQFNWLTPPVGHFHADPFLVEDKARMWMFFEDYVYCESKAAIVCREVRPNGELGQMRTVLRRPHHLSYPFVFKHDGEYYLIPESASNRTVELYRATDFPYQWNLEKVLFRGKAVDTTVFIEGNTFWFFTTLQASAGDGMFLCLFYSDQIDGEWRWHPSNPISMDVRYARCGGRVFRHHGKLIRISQNCAGRYGSSFAFNEIVTMSKAEYRETPLQIVEPWSNSFWGTHTYDFCPGVEVVDGVTYAPKSVHLVSADLPPNAK